MFFSHLLAACFALTSAAAAAPAGQVALSPPVASDTGFRADCPSPVTSYICPLDVDTLTAPAGYLACALPAPYAAHQTCMYKTFANYESVNYRYDGSLDPAMGSDPACERWSRKYTTCTGGDQEEGVCEGEQTALSCPAGFTSEPSLDSETDFACASPTNTCFYYTDSGLLDVSDDGRLDTTSYRREDFDNGCPEVASKVTTCDRVISVDWASLNA